MATGRDQVLIAGACEYSRLKEKGLCKCDYVKNLEMGRLS